MASEQGQSVYPAQVEMCGKMLFGNRQLLEKTSLYPDSKPVDMYPAWVESRLPTAILFVPAVLQPTEGACPLHIGPSM